MVSRACLKPKVVGVKRTLKLLVLPAVTLAAGVENSVKCAASVPVRDAEMPVSAAVPLLRMTNTRGEKPPTPTTP
jgi:hypothetical protein